jgi:hypothetical protein
VLFSGLQTQSEITRLLDELYGSLDSLPETEKEDAQDEQKGSYIGDYLLEPELVSPGTVGHTRKDKGAGIGLTAVGSPVSQRCPECHTVRGASR